MNLFLLQFLSFLFFFSVSKMMRNCGSKRIVLILVLGIIIAVMHNCNLLDTQKSWLDCEHAVITINQPSHLKNAFFYDVDVNRESLGCPEHFGTKFEIFRAKKSMLNFLFCVMNWLWISYAKASWWPQAADCLKGRPRKKICRYIWLVEKRILPLLYRSHLLWTELWGIFLAPTKKILFSKALVTKLFVSPRGDSTAVIVHE